MGIRIDDSEISWPPLARAGGQEPSEKEGPYANCVLPFGVATMLPKDAYTSAHFQRLESDKIWTREWVCVGTEAELPGEGDILPYTVGEQGIHVERAEDGGLIGRFNRAQHGGCREVPIQCMTGKRTRCSFTSCGHSRDRGVISSVAQAGTNAEAWQYVGGDPAKLIRIQVARRQGFVFVNVDPSPAQGRKLEPLSASPANTRTGGHHLEHRANWKVLTSRILHTAETEGTILQAEWLFPNLIRLHAKNVSIAIILQPTAPSATLCRISIFSSAEPQEPAEKDIVDSILQSIDGAANAARDIQLAMDRSCGAPMHEDAGSGWRLNQRVVSKMCETHAVYRDTYTIKP